MNTFVKDVVDHKGNPADRTKTGSWLSAAQILGTLHSLLLCVYIFIFYVCFLATLIFPNVLI